MGIHFLANLASKSGTLLGQRFHQRSETAFDIIRSQFQQQCRRVYTYNSTKPMHRQQPLCLPNPSRFYSSSSSSSHQGKKGFLAWYLGLLDSRPVVTKCVSSAIIFGVADVTSQVITMPPSGSFELTRTLRVAGFGLFFLGSVQHVWYNFLGGILPKRDIITTIKKLVIGQLSYGPFVTGGFFAYNAGVQGENVKEIVARLKRDLIPTIVNGLVYWPICDFITYKIIPVHMQPLWNSSFSFLWTIYLTYMGNQKKAVVD